MLQTNACIHISKTKINTEQNCAVQQSFSLLQTCGNFLQHLMNLQLPMFLHFKTQYVPKDPLYGSNVPVSAFTILEFQLCIKLCIADQHELASASVHPICLFTVL